MSIPDENGTRPRGRVLDLSTFAREAGTEVKQVTVTKVSPEGCELSGDPSFKPEGKVWLKIKGLLAMQAEVTWSKDGDAGCQFVSALDRDTIDQLADHTRHSARTLKGHFGKPGGSGSAFHK